MEKFFDPAGIVVVGVSSAPDNFGRIIVGNLVRWGFAGKIVAVGRQEDEVEGVPVLADMDDAGKLEGCELAVILTPAPTVPGIIRRLGELGIRHAVVETAGFSEFGENGDDLEDELLAASRASGVRFIGPNCVGLLQLKSGTVVPFAYIPEDIPSGDTAIIAQSGGVGLAFMRELIMQSQGVGWMVSIGNEMDVEGVEIADYLLKEKPIGRLLCYLEAIKHGSVLCEAAKQSDTPIVVLKSNRTEAAAGVAQSHTAALANDDKVVSASLEKAGIIRAADSREALLAVHATRLPTPAGRRVGLLSRSGGHAVLAADACSLEGLDLPPFSDGLVEKINAIHPVKVIRRANPLDTGDLFDFSKTARIVESVCAEGGCDGVICVHVYNLMREKEQGRRFVTEVADISRRLNKPVALSVVVEQEELAELRKLVNWPLFESPEDAVRAFSLLVRRHEALERGRGDTVTAAGISAALPEVETGVWSLQRSLALLASVGIPVVPTVGHDADRLPPFPVVAKHSADSESVIHKADLGLVRVNIGDARVLEKTACEIRDEVKRRGLPPGEVLVQPQLKGAEVFLGAKRDRSFGPVVLFGSGGGDVEQIDDVVCWPYPFTMAEIERLWRKTRLPALLGGRLGPREAAPWLAALGELLVRLPAIAEIDVNPVIVNEDGALAVDARVVMG